MDDFRPFRHHSLAQTLNFSEALNKPVDPLNVEKKSSVITLKLAALYV